jgi:hypothetical protein
MKKLAVLAALTLMSLPVLADVGVVNLNNWDNDFPILGIPSGQTAYVQLLGGSTGGTLNPVVSTGDKTTSIFKVDPDGHFDAGVGIVPGLAAAGPASFQLQAWTGAAGSTYATGTVKGQSPVFNGTVTAWNDAAVPAVPAVGAPLALSASVTLGSGTVPEPSTIALGILGAGAMLLIRRRS